ncbi:DUF305 domain-containing protein [Streptomyces vastus]|uniref:DUF305 domain-containing protein n=1 Tax=Streptomyces vastus TaxID=285451 RepID=UPI003CD07200
MSVAQPGQGHCGPASRTARRCASIVSFHSSSPSASASAKAGDHNDQDVSFVEEMIQHHRRAVDMAELADSRASSPEVKDLAAKIKGVQDRHEAR